MKIALRIVLVAVGLAVLSVGGHVVLPATAQGSGPMASAAGATCGICHGG